jgi:hypothetical protein
VTVSRRCRAATYRPCAQWRDERGLTLVELLFAMVAALLVFGAIVSFFPIMTRQWIRGQNRVTARDTDELALARMTRELRGAVAVSSFTSPSQQVTFQAYTSAGAASPDTIVYDCSQPGSVAGTYKCVRTDLTTNPNQSTTVVDGLQNTDVFTLTANSANLTDAAIELHAIVVPAAPDPSSSPGAPVQINDAVVPRNWTRSAGYTNQCPEQPASGCP